MSRRAYTPSLSSLGLPTNDSTITAPSLASNNSFRSMNSASSISNIADSHTQANTNTIFGKTRTKWHLPLLVKRLLKPPTLDFETAIWEIFYLLISPKRVYRSLYYHKQTKNTWSRDDPSFIILLSGFLVVSAFGWGLTYSPGVWNIIKLVVYMVGIDFGLTGCIIATITWLIANKLLTRKQSDYNVIVGGVQELEWQFCFDIHCNSFLIIWALLYLLQFILLPILTLNNWFSLFLGNTLYFVALSYYLVITFYGYNALPFLDHTEVILFPIPVLFILYLISLFGFNVAINMADIYFN